MRTDFPCFARKYADVSPAIPAPIMHTSAVLSDVSRGDCGTFEICIQSDELIHFSLVHNVHFPCQCPPPLGGRAKNERSDRIGSVYALDCARNLLCSREGWDGACVE